MKIAQTTEEPTWVKEEDIISSPNIDEEIRNLLVVLNKKGYKTRFSCSGHKEHNEPIGYIAFHGILTKKELKEAISIIKGYGYKIINAARQAHDTLSTRITRIQFIKRGNT